jgi:hypothetical protein
MPLTPADLVKLAQVAQVIEAAKWAATGDAIPNADVRSFCSYQGRTVDAAGAAWSLNVVRWEGRDGNSGNDGVVVGGFTVIRMTPAQAKRAYELASA